MTSDQADATRTWVLRSRTSGASITITLTSDCVLTVTLAPKEGAPRRDEKKLKDYAGALRYVTQFILEREVRGFVVARDSLRERWAAEAAARAAAEAAAAAVRGPVDPRLARFVVDNPMAREEGDAVAAGWLTLSCGHGGDVDDALLDRLFTDRIETLQLVCDGGGGDDEDDDQRGAPASVKLLRRVADKARPALRNLVLDTYWQTLVRQVALGYGNQWGDLSAVIAALGSLENVYAAGIFTLLKPLASSTLQSLTLVGEELARPLAQLGESKLPALTALGLAGTGEADVHAADITALHALLRDKALPSLRALDVRDFGDPVAVLEAAAARDLAAVRIAGDIGDEDEVMPRLLALAPAFEGAEVSLALDTLSEEALGALQQAWPGLVDDPCDELFLPERYRAFLSSAA